MRRLTKATVSLCVTAVLVVQIYVGDTAVTCPNGYTPLGQTCYKIGRCADWPTAERRCKADQQGFLYKAESETFQHMKNILMGRGIQCEQGFWIGARRHLPDSTFNWRDGSYLSSYSAYWAGGQPDPGENAQCVEMRTASTFNGMLNDHLCNIKKDFVCQACHMIDNCKKTSCPAPSRTVCTECNSNNYFYKITDNGRKCERMCAWNNHYCWPGHCSDNLTKNCRCSPGFAKVTKSTETSCQPILKPSIDTCDHVAIGPNGEKKRSGTSGATNECQYKTDFYGNYNPIKFQYTHHSSFQVNISVFPTKPNFIQKYNFGVTDAGIELVLRKIKGAEIHLNKLSLLVDSLSSQNANPRFSAEGNVSLSTVTLQDGESICLKHTIYGGGFLVAVDTSLTVHQQQSAKPFRKTNTSNANCYYYDGEAPQHCFLSHNCTYEPLHLETRISRTPNIGVEFNGWFDPVPNGGTSKHASSIESYEVRVTEVSGNVKLQVGTSSVFTKKVPSSENHLVLNITSATPKLFCVTLEVKDVAQNVRQSRRFFLFDNSTFIETRSDKHFFVSSATKNTNYKWQTHHNEICLNWKGHFYNRFYLHNKLLNEIEPDYHGLISGIYEQNDGILPVSGTENVYGIVQYTFAFSRNESSFSPLIAVPNFPSQTFCKSFILKDGDTYSLEIGAIDIVNNSYSEIRTVHIDRSVPEIANIWLVKGAHKRIFVHDKTDLSTMELQFDAYDLHSGIKSVEWFFGTADDMANVMENGSIRVLRKPDCPDSDECYCPIVGKQCESNKYSIPLNILKTNNKDTGDHNRNYFFTIKVTNNADLFNIEHIDVLVDDSPPQPGVVMEGSEDGPDLDYTSADTFLVHWHGFIDHESGIKLYKIGLAERCLSIQDFENKNQSDWKIEQIEAPENILRFTTNFTGKRYVSVIALNHAMEPSIPACSDGITKDTTPPVFRNLRLANAKWAESIYCHKNETYLLRSDLTKVKLLNVSAIAGCKHICAKRQNIPFLESIPFVEQRTGRSTVNTTFGVINLEMVDVSEFVCASLSEYQKDTIVYLPNDRFHLSWEVKDDLSQILDFYIGFGQDASEANAPMLLRYISTNRKSFFKLQHAGIGANKEFFIFLKTVNKAGLEALLTVGPVLIDQTPPLFRETPTVKLEKENLVIGWKNDTFYDDEQTSMINLILFQIAVDNTIITPLLEWRKESSTSCLEFSGGCFKYPLIRLHKHVEHQPLKCYVILHVYNNAGHFLTLRTTDIRLPSRYPPGHAVVLDLDPEDKTIYGSRHDGAKDVDAHFSKHKVCARWNGFKHYENITLEFGIGTKNTSDDIYAFTEISNTGFHCVNSLLIPQSTKFFVVLRASSSGGTTLSKSNGCLVFNKTLMLNSFKIHNGPKCFSEINVVFRKMTNSKIDMKSQVLFNHPLMTGKVYTVKLVGSDASISGLTVDSPSIIIHSTVVGDSHTETIFQPTVPLLELTIILVSAKSIYLKYLELYDCQEESTEDQTSNQIQAHWSGLTKSFNYQYALVLVQCSAVVNDSCVEYITSFKQTLDDSVTISGLKLRNYVNYSIIVKPCLNEKCLPAKYSHVFRIESQDIPWRTLRSEITIDESNCTGINIQAFSLQQSKPADIYQWSVMADSLKTASRTMLISWQTVPKEAFSGNTFQVNQCINITKKYALKTLFSCLRAFSAERHTHQTCETITAIRRGLPPDIVYEFDANSGSWNSIKQVLHGYYLGDKLKALHDNEVDFGTRDTKVAGAVLRVYDRNITWFLMRERLVPTACTDLSQCITSMTTTTGYVIFSSINIKYNVIYYICAAAKELEIQRELSTEVLPVLQSCSDGFLLDDIPPYGGNVWVENTNGYINNLKAVLISWSKFEDNIKVDTLGYNNQILSYTIRLGSRAGGKDIKQYDVGGETSFHVRNLTIKDGSKVYFTVVAKDQAGLNRNVTSNQLIVDTSPPVTGQIVIDDLGQTAWVSSNIVRARLLSFEDFESGIDYFMANIGSSGFEDNVFETTKFYNDKLEFVMKEDVVDGHTYFLRVKAVNRAGLSSKYEVMKFNVDCSPPTGGNVMDGKESYKTDVDFQSSTDYISAHWTGFTDGHSGIHLYRAGLGTRPFLDDIEPMTGTGLKTATVWNGPFTPGWKYFVTVEACNGASLCRSVASDGIVLDDSPPIIGLVRVGSLGRHHTYIPKKSSVEIFWAGFEDPQSGIHHFEACIGTSAGLCNIAPVFNCLLASSHIKTNLNMPENTDLYVTVTAYNNNNQSVSRSSQYFRADSSAPVAVEKPVFIKDFVSHRNHFAQWEKSVLRISWKFIDLYSPIVRHVVTVVTHHEGHTPVEQFELGLENKVTIVMDDKHWLRNGDVYKALVTSCNAAGLCTTESSSGLVIDSTPPHLGGFHPPMTWRNVNERNGTSVAYVNLSWYGFHDQESGIKKFYVGIGKSYSGNELSNGFVNIDSNLSSSKYNSEFRINQVLTSGDKIIVSIMAENNAGLVSSISRLTLIALTAATGHSQMLKGVLAIEKHSCTIHFCNKDCTCAVVGQPCTTTRANLTCQDITSAKNTYNISVKVYGGMPEEALSITPSSSCLSAHWEVENGEDMVKRYEWSMGVKSGKPGENIFEPNEIQWKDIGKLQQIVHCLSDNHSLINREEYVVYVRVWVAEDKFLVFHSSPIMVDKTPPAIAKGKFIKDSDSSCLKDYDLIDWADTVTACWAEVFDEQQGQIIYYQVALGTAPGADDVISLTNVGLNMSFTASGLALMGGQKFYFTVTAINNVGLHTTDTSDGFLIDLEKPVPGLVYNTDRHQNFAFQFPTSIFAMSWHGFLDHESGIKTYLAAVYDVENQTLIKNFTDVGLHTSARFTNIALMHGRKYAGVVKAIDAMNHESQTVYSNSKLIDTTAPSAYICRDKTVVHEIVFPAPETSKTYFWANFESHAVYVVSGIITTADSYPFIHIVVAEGHGHSIPSQILHDGTFHFHYNILSDFTGNRTVRVDTEASNAALKEVAFSKCSISLINDTTNVLNIIQISPHVFRARVNVIDPESSVKRVLLGVGSTPGGVQHKDFYPIDKWSDEYFSLSVSHGTPVYATALVENNAGLQSTFFSKRIQIDHTPPVIGDVTVKLQTLRDDVKTNSTRNNETILLQLSSTWNASDDESGIKMCYTFIGSREGTADVQEETLARHTNLFVSRIISASHGKRLYLTVLCINNVELAKKRNARPVIVSVEKPVARQAAVQFIASSTQTSADIYAHDNDFSNALIVQSNKSRLQFFWYGFEDESGIDHYEYRVISQSGPSDWTDVGQRTHVTLDGLDLTDAETYTAEVRASNTGAFISDTANATILIGSREPKFTGKSLDISLTGRDMILNWDQVFELNHEIQTLFDLTIGSTIGASDIADRRALQVYEMSFQIPLRKFGVEDIEELFISLTCWYSTGLAATYKTNYKFNL